MKKLKGKVAIVTGSTQGLGTGIARRLGRAGVSLVINGRNHQKGMHVLDQLNAMGVDAVFVAADLRQKHQYETLVQRTIEHFGRLDILINNAQSVPVLTEAEHDDDAGLEITLESGLFASLWLARAAFPWFRQAGCGRIVNFASINGVYGSKYGLAYNPAKEGVRGLTRTLANEWGRYEITVNTVMLSGLTPLASASLPVLHEKALRLCSSTSTRPKN